MNENQKSKITLYLLGTLEVFIGITGIAGGVKLISSPNGMPEFPIEWLSNSPFASYLIPGLTLLIIIGLGNVGAGIITFLRRRYSGILAVLLGTFLVLYITVEIWYVGLRNLLQPLYFVLGIAVLSIGIKLFKSYMAVHQMRFESAS